MKLKLRHKLAFGFFKPLIAIFGRITYGFKAKKFRKIKKPFVVLCNHVALLDPLLLTLSFKDPIYFVATDIIFDGTLKSNWVKKNFSPISMSKGSADVMTVKNIMSITRQGGVVGIFPSGNTTYSGASSYIMPSTFKLIKKLKVPIVLYRTDGLYGADPRWAKNSRKGKSIGQVQRVLMPEEIEKMSLEEIGKIVTETLSSPLELFALSGYKSSEKAEYLERALYWCPDCQKISTLRSDKNTIMCDSCGYSANYNEDLTLTTTKGTNKYNFISEWFYDQLEFLKNYDFDSLTDDEVICSDESVKISTKKKMAKRQVLQENVKISMYKNRVVIGGTTLMIDEIQNVAVQGRNTLLIYAHDKVYIINAPPRNNQYKYVSFVVAIKNKQSGESNYGILEL